MTPEEHAKDVVASCVHLAHGACKACVLAGLRVALARVEAAGREETG